ncbi:hypothetical protein CC80DRAFT_32181 [Byssothecium circinans]|uniref:Protection of telomeres protein 1 ssDNA-binding domain-containing protein n=1 Tax=Byssothecium circinans TaxID=147558 RepID=A0A6A5U9A5_9PLEO|nr:hypothetical protein CC80DRAFT_32181 [Byssothecium circinans]
MAAFGRRGCLIKDLQVDKFCDLVAEVVKTFYSHDTMDIYVTDYTENKDLFLYTDPDDPDVTENFGYPTAKNWRGPYGQITIMVHLWEPHASFTRLNINEGDIVFLQNVRPKMSQDGKLEAAIHQDRQYPEKICVMKCRDPRQLAGLQQRKLAWEEAQKHKKTGDDQNLPKKASAKASAKRKEKREQQRLQKELDQRELEEKVQASMQKQKQKEDTRAGLNLHVRAGFPDMNRISTIQEIVRNPYRHTTSEEGLPVKLPFINCKYKSHMRVVDMWPATLSDFAQSKGDPKFNPNVSDKDRRDGSHRYEWNFALLVEDAKSPAKSADERITLTFGNLQAQNLLKMDACNLKRDRTKLKELEEKLFILWGNLWERKVALWEEDRTKLPLPSDDPRLQLRNKPFECVIEEYGEPVGRGGEPEYWIRRFSTFNTTIMG